MYCEIVKLKRLTEFRRIRFLLPVGHTDSTFRGRMEPMTTPQALFIIDERLLLLCVQLFLQNQLHSPVTVKNAKE